MERFSSHFCHLSLLYQFWCVEMKGKMMSEQVFKKRVLTKYLLWLWLIYFLLFWGGFPFSSSFFEASTWLRTVWFLLWVIAGQPTDSGLQPDGGEEVWAGQLPAEHRAIGKPHSCCGMHNKSCESSRGLKECPSLALSHLTLLSQPFPVCMERAGRFFLKEIPTECSLQ